MVAGASVGLCGLYLVWEQDLNSKTDSLGLEDAVCVVESQHICGERTQQVFYYTPGSDLMLHQHALFCTVRSYLQTPGTSQVRDPSSGTKWEL